jgi:predicted Zn-dependent protease with MMP-like domain
MGFNLSKLRPAWFDVENDLANVVDLLIHELGHHFAQSHLSHEYHEALTRMAGRVAVLALSAPQLFR